MRATLIALVPVPGMILSFVVSPVTRSDLILMHQESRIPLNQNCYACLVSHSKLLRTQGLLVCKIIHVFWLAAKPVFMSFSDTKSVFLDVALLLKI